MRRWMAGVLVALAGDAALVAVLVPLRHSLSIATPALVLVVPVVAGVAVGGIASGVLAAAAGFLAYDLFFLPPYGTLTVGAAQNWAALFVYAAVVLIVARVVAFLQQTRAEARRHEDATRRLYLLSDLLIGDQPVGGVLQVIADTIHQVFGARWVAVLIPGPRPAAPGARWGTGAAPAAGSAAAPAGPLELAATAGAALSDEERRALSPAPGRTERLHWRPGRDAGGGSLRVVLTARGRPVGLVAMAGMSLDRHQSELLQTYANQAALALERSQLREQALRTELLEQVDHLRASLMGAVSHDLRTPLASIKTAVSALRREPAASLCDADRTELLALVDTQADALDRLVANLLDMTRIQAGALELRRAITPVSDVVEGALRASAVPASQVGIDLPADLPPVEVDQLLMEQAVANLLDNAARHSPAEGTVRVSARSCGPLVELAVSDRGPGVAEADRERVFTMFSRSAGAGRAGLGLAIAKAFVEAHGQRITVTDAPGGGARFVVTMAAAAVPADV